MAVNLKNERVEKLLKELSELTGESLTVAAGNAFERQLVLLREATTRRRKRRARLFAELIASARATPLTTEPEKSVSDDLWGE